MKAFFYRLKDIVSNRLLVMLVIFGAVFIALGTRLYEIQVVKGAEYVLKDKVYTSSREITAPRGEIFDRNGQPLAINRSTVMVKIDTGNRSAQSNDMLIPFVKLMNRYGQEIIDDLPISDTEPREFLFDGSPTREKNWKSDMGLDNAITAQEAYDELINETFKIPAAELTEQEIRQVLSLRQSVFIQRFRKNPVTVALEVSDEICAALEEHNQEFPGVYVDVDYIREYPEGKYMASLLGYTRKITSDQLEKLEPLGYTEDAVVGQVGIELAFEVNLRGTNGMLELEVDQAGRKLRTSGTTPAAPGDKTFLTVDADLTREAYDLLEKTLTDILVSKLKANPNARNARPEDSVTTKEMLASIVGAGNVSIEEILNAETGSLSRPVRDYLKYSSGLDPESEEYDYIKELASFAAEALENGRITENQIILVMYEQEIILPQPEEIESLKLGKLSVKPFLIRMLEEGQITPQMTHINPYSGSVVVVDPNDGSVLAQVSYPSYDNNELVNNFNYDYYMELMNDPTLPMINRPFKEPRAVGSTFKMLTAVAALENGVVTPGKRINDEFSFTKAGLPYAKCTSHHGGVDVVDALCVSCNYYFYDAAYMLGNTKNGNMLEGIRKLNDYMLHFGFGSPTGVEIDEDADTKLAGLPEGIAPIASPEYSRFKNNAGWSDGDTIRTAIGQHTNQLTCGTMAKYTATLANGGTRYELHFLDRIESGNGQTVTEYQPVVEEIVPMSESTIDAVHKGMQAVIQKQKGTGFKIFQGFPIQVGGKTGTAQEGGWPNHTTFAGFAPYDDPQVAIYVLLPGSYQSSIASPAAVVARDVLGAYFRLNAEPQRIDKVNELVMNN